VWREGVVLEGGETLLLEDDEATAAWHGQSKVGSGWVCLARNYLFLKIIDFL
jgi:hypothetical protein